MSDNEEKPIGTPVGEFVREGRARNAILHMNRRVEELNDYIAACKSDGFNVSLDVRDGKIAVAVLLPDGAEKI